METVVDLSIIIPVYNGEKYITMCVNSIYKYHSKINFEIILIDDGSTDRSYQICKQLSSLHKEIKCYSKKNSGIVSSRSFGLEHALGTYITFMDQDDFLVKSYDTFIYALEDAQGDILVSNYMKYQKNNLIPCQYIRTDDFLDKDEINQTIKGLICGNLFKYRNPDIIQLPTSIWNCIIRKEMVKKNHIAFKYFVDYEDDWIFLIECLEYSKKVVLKSDCYYSWRVNPQSESHKKKYIKDLYSKRKKIIKWTYKKLKAAKCNSQDIDIFINKYQRKRTILWVFYNECWKKPFKLKCFKEYIKNVLNRELPRKQKISELLIDNPLEWIFLFLLKYRLTTIAYILNKIVFKRRFH